MGSLDLVVATVIAVCSLLGFQFGLIYFLLNAKITPLEKRIDNLEAGQAKILAILEKIKPQDS